MDKHILQQLYEKYSKEIYIYLLSICHNTCMAEDLLQEVFIKALLSLDDKHTNFRAWLYLVAKNMCLNEIRNGRKIELSELDEEMRTDIEPPDKILENEQKKVLYSAMMKLPQRQREVIVLQYFSQLKGSEISAITGLSAENVRIITYRAKKNLKKYMEENGYGI